MSILTRIFKSARTMPPQGQAQLISGAVARFTQWGGDAYQNDIYRAAVDAIARNVAKLKGAHVIKNADHGTACGDCKLNRLLQVQPNPYMNSFDLLYKLATHYYLHNNAFAFINRNERGGVAAIYPIQATNAEMLADASGALFVRFRLRSGQEVTLPYADIIHLRRHFANDELLGDANDALMPALELAHAQNQGIVNAIRSGANIRGILRFTQIMAPDKMRDEKDRFMKDYLSISNDGGVVATDQKMEFAPITVNPVMIDEGQLKAVKSKIYDYLGISDAIVSSAYTEDQWAAFYESTIEPLATQMSLEFTRKLFTEREQAFGNAILFESGRLQFSANATKIKLIGELMPYGLLTINQALEILNLPGVPDGDKRLQTLNVVDAGKAHQYQLDKKDV